MLLGEQRSAVVVERCGLGIGYITDILSDTIKIAGIDAFALDIQREFFFALLIEHAVFEEVGDIVDGEPVGVENSEYDDKQDHNDHCYRDNPFDRELLLFGGWFLFYMTERGSLSRDFFIFCYFLVVILDFFPVIGITILLRRILLGHRVLGDLLLLWLLCSLLLDILFIGELFTGTELFAFLFF